MELQAAIEALRKLKERCDVELYTDSEYLREGITTWIHAWKARGWKKKVKNKDLWLQLDEIANRHQIKWHWVRGHAGNAANERCDLLSVEAAQRIEAAATPQEREQALEQFLKSRTEIAGQPELLEDDTRLL